MKKSLAAALLFCALARPAKPQTFTNYPLMPNPIQVCNTGCVITGVSISTPVLYQYGGEGLFSIPIVTNTPVPATPTFFAGPGGTNQIWVQEQKVSFTLTYTDVDGTTGHTFVVPANPAAAAP